MRSLPPVDAGLAIVLLRATTALRDVIDTWDGDGPQAAKARLEGVVVEIRDEFRDRLSGVTVPCPHCGEAVETVTLADTGECPRCFRPIAPDDGAA